MAPVVEKDGIRVSIVWCLDLKVHTHWCIFSKRLCYSS